MKNKSIEINVGLNTESGHLDSVNVQIKENLKMQLKKERIENKVKRTNTN